MNLQFISDWDYNETLGRQGTVEKTDSKIEMVVTRTSLDRQTSDFQFWQTQSYQARIDALEQIREEYNRWKYHAEPGFQRVYRIVKQS